jgi:hypothetical protein
MSQETTNTKASKSHLLHRLVGLIENANIGHNIELESMGHILEHVSFDLDSGEYSWIAKISFKNTGNVGYEHPMKNSNYVKTFKTLAGAKRNFLKRWNKDYAFIPNAQDEERI